jgi:dTMP kinase
VANSTLRDKLCGKFIVLDGPDGCGKSTQCASLAQWLTENGIELVKAHDPGGTRIGAQIRQLLKYGAKGRMDVHTETMLFMASRAQLVAEIVGPALKTGKSVLCDRFISSTCAYQGSSGYPVEKIIELGKFAVGDVWPDLTVVIDIAVEEGLKRTGRKPKQKTKVNHKHPDQGHLFANVVVDRFDSRTLEYHRRVRKWFLKLEEKYPGVVRIVDGSNADAAAVHERVKQVILETDF